MTVARARQFRKQLTEHEVKMWSALRELRPQGLHFRRQAPLDGYIVDFVCHRAKVIVEVDGVQHAVGKQLEHDRIRDDHFARSGYLTLRYWNGEIDADLDTVAEGIFQIAMQRIGNDKDPHPRPSAGPSPQGGGMSAYIRQEP